MLVLHSVENTELMSVRSQHNNSGWWTISQYAGWIFPGLDRKQQLMFCRMVGSLLCLLLWKDRQRYYDCMALVRLFLERVCIFQSSVQSSKYSKILGNFNSNNLCTMYSIYVLCIIYVCMYVLYYLCMAYIFRTAGFAPPDIYS